MKLLSTLLLTFYTVLSFAQITYYPDRDSWKNSCADSLVLEDFAGGPTVPEPYKSTGCDGYFSSNGNSCFPAGEIQPGIIIRAALDTAAEPLVYTIPGFINNPTPIVGTNDYPDFTILDFTNDITKVGLDLYAGISSSMHVRIYDWASNLVDTLTITEDLPGPYFFGFVSETPILSIEFEAIGNAVELVGMVEFGNCNVVSVNDLSDYDFNFFPNPATNTVTLQAKDPITSIQVMNLLGQVVKSVIPKENQTSLDIADLSSGTYFIKVQVANNTGVYRLVKE